MTPGFRLEQYTLKRPKEVLLVRALVAGEADEVVIFRGFSSSLVRPTAFDPDVPVLPEGADIQSIDILEGPYTPEHPRYLQSGLSWPQMVSVLESVGV
ncbi:MAG TPA: hypothetical protein IGR64_13040 [Leptolyngbyaceae cyanobacterium M65_K2018_010]|nr:hypothetical protein [Leptolyngbyaceae cyanobacterium M65_K2018_010]